MKRAITIFMSGLVSLFCLSNSFAQAPAPTGSQGLMPSDALPVAKVAPGVFRLGEIQIHKGVRSVTFPAKVNMDKGLLEYLLVKSGGKTHESLLRTDVEPYYLNIAFLLLGFEGTDRPLAEQGAPDIPQGESVTITIVYREGKTNQKAAAEAWIEKRAGDKSESPPMDWKYTGSMVFEGSFLAQVQGSLVAIYHDPAALIDHATPGGESDEVWFVREGVVPAAGTPVTVVIKARD